MEIRRIDLRELRSYWDLVRYAFRDWAAEPPEDPDPGSFAPEEAYGLFVAGELASGMTLRRFRQTVRGRVLSMAGPAGVASYPEWRGKGHIRQLLSYGFERMRREGRVVSMLHPFRESFYERFGYASAPSALELTVPLDSLAHHPVAPLEGYAETRRSGDGARIRFLQRLADAAPPRHNGFVLLDPESPGYWHHRFKDWFYVFVRRDDTVVAGACYRIRSQIRTQGDPPQISVHDLFWEDPESRRALLAYFARHRDQIVLLRLKIPREASFHSWFRDTMSRFSLAMDEKPWMVRIVDLEAAVTGLPSPAQGDIVVEVDDPWCPWNCGRFLLSASGGRLTATPTDGAVSARMDIKAASALVYGTLGAAELSHRGWLEGSTADELDRLLPRMEFYNSLYF